MRDGGHVLDGAYFQAGSLEGSDGSLPSGTRSLYEALHLFEPMFHGSPGGIIRGLLGGIRCALAGAFKAYCAGTGPGNRIAVPISNGNNGVVKRRTNVGNALFYILALALLDARGCPACHSLIPLLFFLSSRGALGTLAGTGVVLGILASDR